MAPQKESERFKVIDAPRPSFKKASSHKEEYAKMLASLKEDQCIESDDVSRGHLYTMAKYIGLKIQTQRQPNGKLRIWRVK